MIIMKTFDEQLAAYEESYPVLETEKHLVHVLLLQKMDDPRKKEYREVIMIQKLGRATFESMIRSEFFSRYDQVAVLHNPSSLKASASATDIDTLTARHIQLLGRAPGKTVGIEEIAERVALEEAKALYKKVNGFAPDKALTAAEINESLE